MWRAVSNSVRDARLPTPPYRESTSKRKLCGSSDFLASPSAPAGRATTSFLFFPSESSSPSSSGIGPARPQDSSSWTAATTFSIGSRSAGRSSTPATKAASTNRRLRQSQNRCQHHWLVAANALGSSAMVRPWRRPGLTRLFAGRCLRAVFHLCLLYDPSLTSRLKVFLGVFPTTRIRLRAPEYSWHR